MMKFEHNKKIGIALISLTLLSLTIFVIILPDNKQEPELDTIICPATIKNLGENVCNIFADLILNCRNIITEDVEDKYCQKNITYSRDDWIKYNYPACFKYFNELSAIIENISSYSVGYGTGCSLKSIGYSLLLIKERFNNKTNIEAGDIIEYIKISGKGEVSYLVHRVIYVDDKYVLTETDNRFTVDIVPKKPNSILHKVSEVFVIRNFTGWEGQHECNPNKPFLDCVFSGECPDETGINCKINTNTTECYERIESYRDVKDILYCGTQKVNADLVEYI